MAFIPFLVLIVLITCCVAVFGNATLDGASQVSLLVASAVSVLVGHFSKRLEWENLEREITEKIASCTPAIIILLLIGAIGGTWMVSGIVPTMIYYGMQIIRPEVFLVSSSLLCALVSLMIGSSWTTVATIGVALMGIGKAHGFEDGWIAGSIITGAYFGDKLSPLSDTTVLASSVAGTPLFSHIRYMMYTTVPTFLISLSIFLVAGLAMNVSGHGNVAEFMEGLQRTFVISPWLLLVPVMTGVMIARRWPSMVVLFLAILLAVVVGLLIQPGLVHQISGESSQSLLASYKGMMRVCYGSTNIETGIPMLNDLVHTSGMGGMMPTIWLIICAQTFGGALTATGQLQDLMRIVLRYVRGVTSLVASTVGTALFCNIAMADQYLSIMLSCSMFKGTYRDRGYEQRLLSRSCEDGATVTSVLVPWNTCGLTQSTVLGVATLTYLPFCFFNYLSPLMSIFVAAIGWKIRKISLCLLLAPLFFFSYTVRAQTLTVVELNCENLFDYRHDAGKQDEEYLPEATRHWTRKRYWRKLNNIAQELLSCSDTGIPDLIALCEVENDSVMHDLTRRSLLRNAGYEYLMTASPDLRGIDVALLYSPFSFAPVRCYPIRVTPVENMRPTRDILYACGLISSLDTLHVFVVHAPSRFGGERYSRPFRLQVAGRLCQSLDSIRTLSPDAHILIAGDFNDGADGPALQQIGQKGILSLTKAAHVAEGVRGTYRYKGEWESIDHILGSASIYNKVESASIHSPLFLLEEERLYGGVRPRRTYNGMRYQPGYSDHLPLVVRLNLSKSQSNE